MDVSKLDVYAMAQALVQVIKWYEEDIDGSVCAFNCKYEGYYPGCNICSAERIAMEILQSGTGSEDQSILSD